MHGASCLELGATGDEALLGLLPVDAVGEEVRQLGARAGSGGARVVELGVAGGKSRWKVDLHAPDGLEVVGLDV